MRSPRRPTPRRRRQGQRRPQDGYGGTSTNTIAIPWSNFYPGVPQERLRSHPSNLIRIMPAKGGLLQEAPAWGIEPVPERLRVLGALDGFLLWANLSVSLLVIVAGAFIGLSACFFFKVEDARLQGILVTLLAFFMGLVIFMIFTLDRPFRGELGLRPDPYQLIYDHLMKSNP